MSKLNADCLYFIFNELQHDKNSLRSCLLVNKEWCNIVVPILWKVHSLNGKSKNKLLKLLNTILSCLPSSSKQFLSDNGIKLPSNILLKPSLFDYISFCKFTIIDSIVKMADEIGFNRGNPSYSLLEQEIYKLFVSHCKNIKKLQWKTSQPLSLFPGASTCFSQLYSLVIDISFVNSDILFKMAQICRDLNRLTIDNCSQAGLISLTSGLISLIDAQRHLKSVEFKCKKESCKGSIPLINPKLVETQNDKRSCKELSEALARKGNTINYLHLDSDFIQPSCLTSLINLKKLSICDGEDNEDVIGEFQKYLAITEFPELEYLYVDGSSYFKELTMLIEKSKGNIFVVDIFTYNKKAKNTGMLIEVIANNCPKIKRLATYLEPGDFLHVKSLLLNCRYLSDITFRSLDFVENENDNIGDRLLDILTEFSPNSLIKIVLSGSLKYSIGGLERFFESCRNRTLLYFEISCEFGRKHITESHKVIVKKYVKKGVIKETNDLFNKN